jgi:hypothetical protein
MPLDDRLTPTDPGSTGVQLPRVVIWTAPDGGSRWEVRGEVTPRAVLRVAVLVYRDGALGRLASLPERARGA